MLSKLQITLIEIFFTSFVFVLLIFSLSKFQKQVILDILKLNRWYSSFNYSFSESIDMILLKRYWSHQEIIAGTHEIDE